MYGYLLKNLVEIGVWNILPVRQVRRMQIRRFRCLFEHAREHSPFYRDIYSKAGVHDLVVRTADDIKLIPTVDKRMMREYGVDRVLTVPADLPDLHTLFTSGSTGEPFTVRVQKHVDFSSHFRVFSAFWWNGYRPTHRLVTVWRYSADKVFDIEKQSALGILQKRLGILQRTIIPSFESPDVIIERLRAIRPHVLFATRPLLDLIADDLARRHETLPIPIVISGAETLLPEHRELFVSVFGGKILNLYGCMESPSIGIAHDDSDFRILANSVYVEYINPYLSGDNLIGEIVITNLLNQAMPFIRYRLGDIGKIQTTDETQWARFIGPVEGRVNDVLILSNGFRFAHTHAFQLAHDLFDDCLQFKFIQKSDGQVVEQLRLIDPAKEAEIRRRAQAKWDTMFPDVHLEIEFKTELAPAASGKFKVIEKL